MAGHSKTPIEKREGPYRVEGFPLLDSSVPVTVENTAATAEQLCAHATSRVRDLVMQFQDTAKEGTYLVLAMEVARKQLQIARERALGKKQEAKDAENGGSEPGGEADSARSGLSPDFGEALRAGVPDDDAEADRGAGDATEA